MGVVNSVILEAVQKEVLGSKQDLQMINAMLKTLNTKRELLLEIKTEAVEAN